MGFLAKKRPLKAGNGKISPISTTLDASCMFGLGIFLKLPWRPSGSAGKPSLRADRRQTPFPACGIILQST
jgi:hypothetical protein